LEQLKGTGRTNRNEENSQENGPENVNWIQKKTENKTTPIYKRYEDIKEKNIPLHQ